jgi:hypothetical protein
MSAYLSDDDLAVHARDLEAHLDTTTGWHEPPRLYGLVCRPLPAPFCHATCRHGTPRSSADVLPGGDEHAWVLLAEGDPYVFLDEIRVDERTVGAVALVTNGWSTPPEDYDTWRGRPSEHPRRRRVRAVVVVTPDLRQRTALRVRGPGAQAKVVDGGEGPMVRALHTVWWAGGRAA